ncbi:glycoside hydrolase family 81 protein [Suhomyces tanzawaensis NRRL Y-17324]|uniref:glucan endo-1,3-beta-D-glucosidase n=1 Tax=Suhomyces tanzawaensis NRRL Y-17324 TaxID=984487 RepID=A0A1E4SDA7_9ASCO|nr:glycoside hydrolase family 81 protein [Suhomyces tanzawaensis NRRL Y-17324]ODV77372.1 glycoside hydrolase family 81 protein [Suhomyces tanzawaensis NRRL Y-17324]
MIFKSLTSFLAILLALAETSSADEVYTVTKTNYITPDCLKYKAQSILQGNPIGATTGIPIVFVYADSESTEAPKPVTASDLHYTVSTEATKYYTSLVCGAESCQTHVVPQVYTDSYTSSTRITYTTLKTALTSSPAATDTPTTSKKRSTIYQYDTTTEVSTAQAVITKTAPTTTTTIFKATTVPKTVFKPTTEVETISTTQKNPLVTQSAISKSLDVTISASFSDPVTFSRSAYANSSAITNGTSRSNATLSSILESRTAVAPAVTSSRFPSIGPVAGGPIVANSTIDLRLSSSVPTTFSTIGKYSNSSVLASSSSLSNSTTQIASNSSSAASSSLGVSTTLASSTADSSSSVASSSTLSSSSSLSSSSAPAIPSGSRGGATTGENNSGDLFSTISTDGPLSIFTKKELPLSIPKGVDNDGIPISTNKFHANLFLDDQTQTIWPLPYGLFWKKQDYYGFGVTHANSSQYIYGYGNSNNEDVPSYYLSATGNAEVILSATSFGKNSNNMKVTQIKEMSVLVSLSADENDSSNHLDIPIAQGMGFVTGIYNGNLTPLLNSLIGFKDLTQESSDALDSRVQKYRATLFNGAQWLIYAILPNSSSDFKLSASDSFGIKGSSSVDGLIIQVAYAPSDSKSEGFYDEAAGSYVTDAKVTGAVSGGTAATYNIEYTAKGTSSSGKPIIFALPHQVESLAASTKQTSTGIKLDSNTKGVMLAFLTSTLALEETLNTNVQFLPWAQTMTSELSYTSEQLNLLAKTANEELAVDIDETVASMDSTYYSGKVLDKYAYILLVVSDIIKDEKATKSTLEAVKKAFDTFFQNKQHFPFMYDTKFGGVTSTSAQNGDTGADFGSAYYNDHHFHYGYYVHAAAIVGYVDKKLGGTWAEDNKEWVNNLIRDVANPSSDDKYFPVSRMFDWYHGHSWAAGLFVSGDGKNEESSSEDYNFAYGMRLWGKVIGDDSMKSRGDLMLSIMSRAMNMYFLYKNDNTVEPSKYIPNKVSGIMFENKIAYTTYFGSPDKNPEYLHGIHMLPITPASSVIRTPSYVKEEWDDQISTFIGKVNSGWTGILRLNQALYDAKSSYDFFSSSDWNTNYLDNGQSRTWSLAFSGGLANSS